MLPAHFSLSVISLTFTEYYRPHPQSQTHRWLSSLPANYTSDLYPEDVSWCDWLPLPPQVGTPTPAFSSLSPHISAITAQHAYNHVLASHLCISFVDWFVSSVPLDGMCLFSAFSANLDVDATLKKKKYNNNKKNKTTKNMFPNCGGWGLGGEHNINQGRWVRNTARGSSRHPTSS